MSKANLHEHLLFLKGTHAVLSFALQQHGCFSMISSALVATPVEKHCMFKNSLKCGRQIHNESISNTEIGCPLHLFVCKEF